MRIAFHIGRFSEFRLDSLGVAERASVPESGPDSDSHAKPAGFA
jgi:hypothetical protein